MATVIPTNTTTPSTANASSYAAAAFTPAIGDLIVVVFSASGTVGVGDATDNQGGTYTLVTSAVRTAAHTLYILVRDQLVGSASSTTVTCTLAGDAGTGAEIHCFRVSGISVAGLAAVRRSAKQDNNTGGTPAPVLSAAALTTNPLIGAVQTASNPPALTAPSGWAEAFDHGHSTPTGGTESVYRNSGFTGTTVTWGSSTGTVDFASLVIELDGTSTANANVTTTMVAAVAALFTSVVTAGALVALSGAVAAVTTIPTPLVDATTGEAGVNVFLPSEVAAVAAIPTPTVTASALVSLASEVAATTTIPTPVITAVLNLSVPAAVAAVAAIPTPVIGTGVTVTTTTVDAVAAIDTPGSPIVDQDAFVRSGFGWGDMHWGEDAWGGGLDTGAYFSVAAVVAIPTPVISAGIEAVSLTTVTAVAAVPTPVVTISFPGTARHSRVMERNREDWVQQGNVPRRREAPRKIRA